MDILENIEENLLVFAAILVGIAAFGFFGYSYLKKNFGGAGSTAGNSQIAGAQQNTSVLDSVVNGGVSLGDSSQSYTGAFGEVITHPIDSLKTILGF